MSYSSEAGNESILHALWEKYENTGDKVINAADLLVGSPMLPLVPCYVALKLCVDAFHSKCLFYFISFLNEKMHSICGLLDAEQPFGASLSVCVICFFPSPSYFLFVFFPLVCWLTSGC